MKKHESGIGLVRVFLALILVALILAAVWIFFQNKELHTAPDDQKTKNTEKSDRVKKPVEKYGYIKGMASYPSEGLPEDEEVCAQDIANASTAPYCTNVGRQQTLQYELKVPVGTYYVYSQTSQLPGYKAYYNEYSKCGNSADCPEEGHKQYIPVLVKEGSVVENIDPGDWYAN